MAIRNADALLRGLDLPDEFEDLAGLLDADLRAIVEMLAQRGDERLLLTRRQHRQLQAKLWNGLTSAINDAVAPLSADLH